MTHRVVHFIHLASLFIKEHVQLRFGDHILRIVVQLEQTWQFDQVIDIITYGLLYFGKI